MADTISQFLYPLPRAEGYEFMFSQFSGHRCHFTSLINYQQHQENAPILLTLTHYIDLQNSRGELYAQTLILLCAFSM